MNTRYELFFEQNQGKMNHPRLKTVRLRNTPVNDVTQIFKVASQTHDLHEKSDALQKKTLLIQPSLLFKIASGECSVTKAVSLVQ